MKKFRLLTAAVLIAFAAGCASKGRVPPHSGMPETDSFTFSICLPPDIRSEDVVSARVISYSSNGQPAVVQKVTVGDRLADLRAHCEDGHLVDGNGREIYFYRLTGCWGNPPFNYREILRKQSDELEKLKSQFTVIEMTCNPSGIPIP